MICGPASGLDFLRRRRINLWSADVVKLDSQQEKSMRFIGPVIFSLFVATLFILGVLTFVGHL